MSGPKHLWSGDWQRESDDASADLERPLAQPAEPARPEPPEQPPTPRRSGLRRSLPIILVAVVVLAGAAYGLASLASNSGSSPAPTTPGAFAQPPAAPTTTTTTTTTTFSKPVSWLGMEIATIAPGAASVETVAPGSAGDLAGLEPGDVIVQINNHPITGASDIASAIKGLHAGQQVQLQIANGSALYDTAVTLGAPPSAYP